MTNNFFDAVKNRRTYYNISADSPVTDERLREIVEYAVKHSPSAFNSQSGKTVLLLAKHHEKLWNMTEDVLRGFVPADQFQQTADKMQSFRAGHGTVLFFEDQNIVKSLQEQFPLYAANFPVWSSQSSAMLQFVVWTGLETEGLGASLQHYNELIEGAVKAEWKIAPEWKLIAQMPFGKPTSEPGEKSFEDISKRSLVFG
ncbi:MAG TPA: nitroreductase family protein [Spirochaetota bacterium]|nr:nitroreductase family protein [Spirochaetota bacterium]